MQPPFGTFSFFADTWPIGLMEGTASALHENIKAKGQNSYYYAHATTAPPEARYVSGDGPPQLVSGGGGGSGPSVGDSGATAAAPLPSQPFLPITRYSWADDEKEVCIYIPVEGSPLPAKEECEVTTSLTSATITFPSGPTQRSRLVLDGLFADISSARVVVGTKQSRLVLKLVKALAAPWHKLRAADRPFAGDDE